MDDVVGGVHGKKHLLSLLKKELRSASIPSDDAIQALHASFRRLLLQDEQHFDFAADEVSSKFNELYRQYEQEKAAQKAKITMEQEENLNNRLRLIAKLRALIDDQHTYPKLQLLREMEKEWARYEPVPPSRQRELQHGFFSLTRQFYEKRKLFVEAEDLNKKRVFERKTALSQKLEALLQKEPSAAAYKEFRALCSAYERMRSVPEDKKQSLREAYTHLVGKLNDRFGAFIREEEEHVRSRLAKKQSLLEEMQEAACFHSERIDDWMEQSKRVLRLKEAWAAIRIGAAAPEGRRLANEFWKALKKYIKRRGVFFKGIEAERAQNLSRKNALIEEVRQLCGEEGEENWDVALSKFKSIHKEWRSITLLPLREKEGVNLSFKKAMDAFFEQAKGAEQKQKEAQLPQFREKYAAVLSFGTEATDWRTAAPKMANVLDQLPKKIADEPEKSFVRECVHPVLAAAYKVAKALEDASLLGCLRGSILRFFRASQLDLPSFLARDNTAIRKKMRTLRENLHLWRQNIQLLAPSPGAQKIKEEMHERIKKSELELLKLKASLGE